MVFRSHRRGTALYIRAGKFRAHDLGICRNRLPARHRRLKHIRTRPAFTVWTAGLNGKDPKNEKKARRPSGHRANFACLERDTCWLIPRKYGSNVQVIAAHPQASPFPQHDYDYIALSRAPSAVLLRTVPKTPALASDAMRASS